MSEFGPKRSQYRGRLAADPSTVGLPAGSWWFRTDIRCWKWFDGTSINPLPIYTETVTQEFYIDTAGNCAHANMSVAVIGSILVTLHVDVIKVEPPQCDVFTPQHWAVSSTTIGVTIGIHTASAAGTTITIEAIFQGCRP